MKFIKLFNFKGGIRLPDDKSGTGSLPVTSASLPQRVILPLLMSAGKEARPLVSAGQRVRKYEKIAEADGNFSLPVHASISGIVKDMGFYMHPTLGLPVRSVTIESDNLDEPAPLRKNSNEYFRMSPKELVGIIKEAGICGLGGAAFPTHVKLTPPRDKEVQYVIVNGCECEPMLTADDALMVSSAKKIVEGLRIVMHILGADKGVIAIEGNKPAAISAISKMVAVLPNVDVAVLKTRYPQGGEKQVIKAVLGREVPSDCLPCDVASLVLNVATCAAVRDAVVDGLPYIERVVTVSGDNVKSPANLLVRLGTLCEELLKQCGYDGKAAKIIMGGPMMGVAMPNQYLPVVKGTSGILAFSSARIDISGQGECIRCGRCIDVCPMHLFPCMIYKLTRKGLVDELIRENVPDCIECGSCSYVCPSKLYLVQTIRYSKGMMLSRRRGNG